MRAGHLVCAAGAIAAAVTGAAAVAAPMTPQTITSARVGEVKLGRTYASLRRQGLLGRIRPGCPLGGPSTRSAVLRAPLKGFVNLTLTPPRKVRSITVTRGAAARGVGIGATAADIKAAFPKAKVDHSTEETFGLTLVRVPSGGGGRLVFGVETSTQKVSTIGIPAIAFCE